MNSTYDIGDRRKLTCQVKDEGGALADPDALVFQMRHPDGSVIEYQYGTDSQLVRVSVGVFYVYWDCAVAGIHRYRWTATGALAAAEESGFQVRGTVFLS